MKKFVIVTLTAIISAVTLSGCSAWEETVEKNYPYVEYQNDWVNTTYDRKIIVPDGYIINAGHSYDIIETENGCDIVIHLVENDTDN